MSDEPIERDVEVLTEKEKGLVQIEVAALRAGHRHMRDVFAVIEGILAERIAQARREGAAEVEARVKVALAELYDTEKPDALRVSRAMIALGERGPELLAALERDRAALRGDA